MGKGDKKTKRGKITIGSYGVKRQKKRTKTFVAAPVVEKKVVEEKVTKVKKVAAPKAEKKVEKPKAETSVEKPKAKKTTKKATEKSDQKDLFTEDK